MGGRLAGPESDPIRVMTEEITWQSASGQTGVQVYHLYVYLREKERQVQVERQIHSVINTPPVWGEHNLKWWKQE